MERESQVLPHAKNRVLREVDIQEEKDSAEAMKTNKRIIIIVYVVLILLGVGTGYLLATQNGSAIRLSSPGTIKTDTVVGSTDTTTFKDSAEGVIEAGGLGDEGSHKLIREGGPSQTAYLVSSVIDMDEYVGKKVRVWGQTMAAKKVSWLMDVGKIEFLSE